MEEGVAWKECKVCGEGFEARGNMRTCSKECSIELNSKTKKESGRKYREANSERLSEYFKIRHKERYIKKGPFKIQTTCDVCGHIYIANTANSKFCSETCKKEHIYEYQRRRMGAEDSYRKDCRNCGVVFYTKNKNVRLCSDECRRQVKNKSRISINVKVCVVCGNTFSSPDGRTKSCSDDCKAERRLYTKYYSPTAIRNRRIYGAEYNSSAIGTKSSIKSELKRELGFEPPPDLVEEATALRLLNRAIKNAE